MPPLRERFRGAPAPTHIHDLVQACLERHPGERARLAPLVELPDTDPAPTSRATLLRVVLGPRHEPVSPHAVVLHGTCEGKANRFVPYGDIDKPAAPVPPYVGHRLQLIGG
ncbi:hypothetical protein PUR61_16595 [Streptomyces sp. BE20]|uniref:hypothetical protein n=1 Tax=Streptomyces sp. BE20 TaxID=3002525 RepID=UPI002E78D200|nr:hypothetical protein [Streptomyces sp. BE20]MEE1823798.1 hypothetical protein [Streptomyces sp. BE20]